jgi:hypothetical protein
VKVFIGLAAILCVSTAMASGGGPLFPSYISTLNTGIAYVYFTGARTGTIPACAAGIGGTYFRFAFDTNTPGGRAQLANLLAAAAEGINVWFQGTGDCGVEGTTESLMQVHPDQ